MPWRPEAVAPEGVKVVVTATSRCGFVKLGICRRASRSVNQSVSIVTGSTPRSSARIASIDSYIMRRCSVGSMPIM